MDKTRDSTNSKICPDSTCSISVRRKGQILLVVESLVLSTTTEFSLYFKIRAKKFHAAKPLAFSLHFLFRRDQNHYSNSTSNFMKMREQIFKKDAPNTIQIL